MLTPYLPYPPASGGQIRTHYLLKYLARNHSITLVSLYKDEIEKQYAKHLRSYCSEIHLCKRASKPWRPGTIMRAIFTNQPFLIVRNFSQEASDKIQSLLKNKSFDVIHAETFYIMPHIPETTIPVLLVEQTIEYKVYQHYTSSLPFFLRLPLYLDILKLKYWEKFYWTKADLVATVSEYDKNEIKRLASNIEPEVIPNGAGDEMFVKQIPLKKLTKPKLLFLGNFYWLQNVEAAKYLIQSIYPLLNKNLLQLELIIAGQNAGGKILTTHKNNISIVDLNPGDEQTVKKLYHSATLFIAPIFGPGGTRLKILASMASGLPVVSTSVGVQGLGIVNNQHALIAQSPEEFVEQIQRILSDEKLYQKIQNNAFKLVSEKFSWKSIAKKLENVYRNIINRTSKDIV